MFFRYGSELKIYCFQKYRNQALIFIPIPQAIGCIETSHKALKNYISKFTMKAEVEWNKVVNIACPANNFFPNGQSHESAFFLMF